MTIDNNLNDSVQNTEVSKRPASLDLSKTQKGNQVVFGSLGGHGDIFHAAICSFSAESVAGKILISTKKWAPIEVGNKKLLVNINSVAHRLGINSTALREAAAQGEDTFNRAVQKRLDQMKPEKYPQLFKSGLTIKQIALIETFMAEKVLAPGKHYSRKKTTVQWGNQTEKLPFSVTQSKEGETYITLSKKGAGATKKASIVFNWTQAVMGARVVVRKDKRAMEDKVKRTRVEIERLGQFKGKEEVIQVYSVGDIKGRTTGAVFELMDGDLMDFVRDPNVSPQTIREIAIQGAKGIETLHEKKLVHRDIKPDNFLYKKDGDKLRVKISDLDISTDCKTELDKIGLLAGTPGFMAPELDFKIDENKNSPSQQNKEKIDQQFNQIKKDHHELNLNNLLKKINKVSAPPTTTACAHNMHCSLLQMAISIADKYKEEELTKEEANALLEFDALREQWGKSIDAFAYGKSLKELFFGQAIHLRFAIVSCKSQEKGEQTFRPQDLANENARKNLPPQVLEIHDLISALTDSDPSKRPTVTEARKRLEKIDLSGITALRSYNPLEGIGS